MRFGKSKLKRKDGYNIKTETEVNVILCDPEVTANIYCKPRNLPNTDTQNYSTDFGNFWVTQYIKSATL